MNQYLSAFNPVNVVKDLLGISMWGRCFIPPAAIIMIYLSLTWGSSWWEILGAVTGVICVVLVAERKITNYFWGLVNCSLYGLACYYNQYWGEMALNWGIYLPFQFIGMYFWSRSTGDATSVKAKSLTNVQFIAIATLVLLAIYGGEQYLLTKGGRHPMLDSAVVVLSLAATALMAGRYREQWICWILANVVAIMMWRANVLDGNDSGIAMLLMWCSYLINSLYGYWIWYKLEYADPDTVHS